jgi:hypothetical protein
VVLSLVLLYLRWWCRHLETHTIFLGLEPLCLRQSHHVSGGACHAQGSAVISRARVVVFGARASRSRREMPS